MKPMRFLLALALGAGLAGVAYVSQRTEPAGSRMTRAADKFVDSLKPEQKARAVFAFDDKERLNWHFVPLQDKARQPTRKGLAMEEMTPEQKEAVLSLLASGTSPDGDRKAMTIMSLENILRDLEKGGAMVRNPNWYFVSIFGKPSASGKWGWRVEGHHLSLNFTIDSDKVASATPAFFGANPATVMSGPRKGLRPLPEAEDLAKELFQALDEDQKKLAYQKEQFPEITQGDNNPAAGPAHGIPADKMTEKQRTLLLGLLRTYTNRMPADVAEVEMNEVKEAGLDKVHFAYAGSLEPGQPHTYRVQGPTFVVEFLNVQTDGANNPANHIHSVWRTIKGDFGVPLQ